MSLCMDNKEALAREEPVMSAAIGPGSDYKTFRSVCPRCSHCMETITADDNVTQQSVHACIDGVVQLTVTYTVVA